MKKIHEEFVMEIGNIKVTHTVEETSAETGSKKVTTDNFELDDIRIESSGTNKGKEVSAINPEVVVSGYAKAVPVMRAGTIEPFNLNHEDGKTDNCDTCKITSCRKNPNFDPETANEFMSFGSFADFINYLMHEASDGKDETEDKQDQNNSDHAE